MNTDRTTPHDMDSPERERIRIYEYTHGHEYAHSIGQEREKRELTSTVSRIPLPSVERRVPMFIVYAGPEGERTKGGKRSPPKAMRSSDTRANRARKLFLAAASCLSTCRLHPAHRKLFWPTRRS
jgi:hypothetical protein